MRDGWRDADEVSVISGCFQKPPAPAGGLAWAAVCGGRSGAARDMGLGVRAAVLLLDHHRWLPNPPRASVSEAVSSAMVTCARRGCGADLSPAAAAAASAAPCLFHPGAPVFHEGLKSWSCCKDINKPVMEFDQFMAIAGCTTANAHTTEKQALPAPADTPAQAAAAAASHVTEDGTEVFGSAPAPSEQTPQQPVTQPLTGANLSAAQLAAVAQKKGAKGTPPEEEADPPAADAAGAVPDGTKCKRNGCGHTAQGTSTGARCRADESCSYHPGVPIFHEGSKVRAPLASANHCSGTALTRRDETRRDNKFGGKEGGWRGGALT